ncbi:MAG: dihydrolipoyl dehydrogenase [Elusimicrobia bacterium]|nr:dihydrolipoyl dehydrogenase [Elusimicrobiota bacterium]
MKKHLVIIGGGPGGCAAALHAARAGLRATVVERQAVGGTCLHQGCIPSKYLLSTVKAWVDSQGLTDRGLKVTSHPPDVVRLMVKKREVIETLHRATEQSLKQAGVEVIVGTARLQGAHEVQVTNAEGQGLRLEADGIILAPGSHPTRLRSLPNDPRICTSDEALELTQLPSSVLIIGGGYIGCELACIFQGLGTAVTIVEQLPHLLATQETLALAAPWLERSLERRGIKVLTNTRVESACPERSRGASVEAGQRVHVRLSNSESLESELILAAVGRTPALEGLGLEQVGVRCGAAGVVTTSFMETSVPGIYAIGDVAGRLPLAHAAAQEAIIAVEHLLGNRRTLDYHTVPVCVYTWPELAGVGFTEEQARQAGRRPHLSRFPFAASGKAIAEGEPEGMWFLISDEQTGTLLGSQIVGPHATELIHEVAIAMKGHLTISDIETMTFAHPTLSEGFQEAFHRSLHAIQR